MTQNLYTLHEFVVGLTALSCENYRIAQMKYFKSQEEISCDKKKFLVTRRNFLSKEEISYERKNCAVT